MNRLAINVQISSGSLSNKRRAGLDPVGHERGQHHRRRGVGGQTQRQHRHQRARRRGVVGRLRAGDALDGTLAELLGVLGQLLLGDVAQEGRQFGATGRQRPEREPEGGATQPRLPGPLPVLVAHPGPADRDDLGRAPAQMRGHPERLTEGEDRHRDHHDVDAVRELRQPERGTRLPGQRVDADQPDRQSQQQRDQPAQLRGAQHRGDRDQGEQHDRQVRRRAEGDREPRHRRGERRQQDGADGARRRTTRWPPSPAPGRRGRPWPSCCPRSR